MICQAVTRRGPRAVGKALRARWRGYQHAYGSEQARIDVWLVQAMGAGSARNNDLLGWIVLHHLATTSDFTTAAHLNRLETLSFASHRVLVGTFKEGSDHLALPFTPPGAAVDRGVSYGDLIGLRADAVATG